MDHGGADSPLAGDDNKGLLGGCRRGLQKRSISVRGSRGGGGRGETYPPSDSWAWRKYGQKPIKGSPFPRGYYRCSSSKGCPARKQVERSHVDPSMLVVTYAGDHNHSVPASKNAATFSDPGIPSSPETPPRPASPDMEEEHRELFSCGLGGGDALVDFSWLSDLAMEGPCFVGPMCVEDADMVTLSMRAEDESLFADLDELPECSAVFRRGRDVSTCNLGATSVAATFCSRTG